MAVAPSSQQQQHVVPKHAPSTPTPSPPTDQRVPDMAAATSDASAMPALGGENAPADANVMDSTTLTNRLAPLGDAIDFAQSADMAAADMAAMPMQMASAFPSMDTFMPPTTNERLTAFARLRFDDGSYYMHTYQITLGRNIHLAHRDMKRLIKAEALHAKGHTKAAEEYLKGKKDKKKKRDRRGARSVISEKGGIVNVPIESMPMAYQQRRQSNASHSLSSNSHPTGESAEEKPADRAPQDMLMQAFPEVPAQFDGHVPEDPNDCPFVPIHPQQIIAKTGSLGPKGISREHAKIFFDFGAGHFCIHVLGNNGLHHEGEFYPRGETVPLDHGDHLLIGAVNIHFYLPDVALTEQQRHRQESGSRPMSFSFENGNGQLESDEHISSESEDQQSVNPRHVYYHHPVSESDDDDALADEEMDDYEEPVPKPRQKTNLKLKIKNLPPASTSKHSKKAHKRKHQHRELTPEEPASKKVKIKVKDAVKTKEPAREPVKESKAPKERREAKEQREPKEKDVAPPKPLPEPKEPKEPKDKGKAPAKTPAKTPAKAPAKTPVKSETPVEESVKDIPMAAKPDQPSRPPPNDSPPLLRKPHEGELEAGDVEGLITAEMAKLHSLPASLIGHVVEKRKGPGRPPKDGVMSKRQRAQLIKQAKDIDRARAAGIDPADIPIPTIKPKAPKRKESNAGEGEDGGIMETTEQGDGLLSGLQKQAKPIRPPRTPSPEMRIEDYTEEQLQRPTANYVVLIHEAISSSPTGQMNLQSIYTYIERKYPWYKFKTTTSGWQSSVRHNLGQHDAFMKGDKEGKGYLWRINPDVSIEKERRKRQASPPLSHAPRPQYYQPPNGYPPYHQPGYPYHPGMSHAMPQAPPRLPPSLAQPRLPPSMARSEGNAAAPSAPQNAPHPSPYASPWGGGGNNNNNTAGSPPAPNPPRPYPQPNSQTPPVSSTAGSSGQYGVLFPTAAPQQSPYSGPSAPSPYGGPYATAGASPYGPAPPRPYPTYPTGGQQSNAPPASPAQRNASPYGPPPSQGPQQQNASNESSAPHPSGRYPIGVHPDLIRQLEAYRLVYLEKRPGPDEQKKVDNAIRACVDRTVPEATLTEPERKLLESICGVASINKHVNRAPAAKPEDTPVTMPATAAGTAAAIAADAAANTLAQQQHQQPAEQPRPATGTSSPAPMRENSEPHKFTPNMTGASPAPPAATAPAPAPPSTATPAPVMAPSHRPSVEPITPVPGSPAVQSGTPLRRPITELTADSPPAADSTKMEEQRDEELPKVE
ncbi:forkhead domain-containing protein [Stemphylium lycopersici]|uniref:Forkhead domain-containing protein n=1 Tax=Stemphylium lycopersici TaxID=183478 RepID=A0A364MX50_STELY|nr:forkhead domain-containing protein [Stemphylium lycopersici]RAR06066.1 forkhead domain-containing protein [Stemphylium lycopersici]